MALGGYTSSPSLPSKARKKSILYLSFYVIISHIHQLENREKNKRIDVKQKYVQFKNLVMVQT